MILYFFRKLFPHCPEPDRNWSAFIAQQSHSHTFKSTSFSLSPTLSSSALLLTPTPALRHRPSWKIIFNLTGKFIAY